jgi:hypothetical protein
VERRREENRAMEESREMEESMRKRGGEKKVDTFLIL